MVTFNRDMLEMCVQLNCPMGDLSDPQHWPRVVAVIESSGERTVYKYRDSILGFGALYVADAKGPLFLRDRTGV